MPQAQSLRTGGSVLTDWSHIHGINYGETNPRPHSLSKLYSNLSQSCHTVHIYHLANPLPLPFCISHFPVAFKEKMDMVFSLNYLLPNHCHITLLLLKCTKLPCNTVKVTWSFMLMPLTQFLCDLEQFTQILKYPLS